MKIDRELLTKFDAHLNPQRPELSPIQATVVGYGEISSIFQINSDPTRVYKRLPLFASIPAAQAYEKQYHEYCGLLAQAGLTLPDHGTLVVANSDRPVTVYIAQNQLAKNDFGHNRIHHTQENQAVTLIEQIVTEIDKVWVFNSSAGPSLKLALDGQLSNWVRPGADEHQPLVYIDTSTPLFRKDGVEQLDPELFLKSAPGFLRWILRLFFVQDVINRYYDQRMVYMDVAANLYKEQRPDLIPATLEVINSQLRSNHRPLTIEAVSKYYREDKLIWTLFLMFRRLDRWLTTHIFRKRYEYILPGRIKR